MVEPHAPERVLVACRGWIARRLLAFYRSIGIETVAVFSEPDAEASWLEEADFDAYLNGRTVLETYLCPERVVGAAMDAGCDAIHPGDGPLAEHLELYDQATKSNLGIIGIPPGQIRGIVDRRALFEQARRLQIPVIPSSGVIEPSSDGVEQAARLSLPVLVRAVCCEIAQRVDTFEALPAALAWVRDEAERISGDRAVFLEGVVRRGVSLSTVVVADRHGTCVHLGHLDDSLSPPGPVSAQIAGAGVVPQPLWARLGEMSLALAHAVGWLGVGLVRWRVTPEGDPWLVACSARLPTGLELVEAIQGVDLIEAQHRAVIGERLSWQQPAPISDRCGIQIRLRAQGEGRLDTLALPTGLDGVQLTEGADPGQLCSTETDPLLAKITVVDVDRTRATQRMHDVLAQVQVSGVQGNLGPLRGVFADEARRSTDDPPPIG